jgi:hypothetical protein
MGGVVEEATREGKVLGSNPPAREACDFRRKNARLATWLREPLVEIYFHCD